MSEKHAPNHNTAPTSLKGCTHACGVHAFMMFLWNSHFAICMMQLEMWFIGPHDFFQCSTLQSLCSCVNWKRFILVTAGSKGVQTGLRLPYPMWCSIWLICLQWQVAIIIFLYYTNLNRFISNFPSLLPWDLMEPCMLTPLCWDLAPGSIWDRLSCVALGQGPFFSHV